MTPPTPPAVRAAAEVYATSFGEKGLARHKAATDFIAGAAWAFAEAARIAESSKKVYPAGPCWCDRCQAAAEIVKRIRAAAGPAGG